jgi:hypothetical protein
MRMLIRSIGCVSLALVAMIAIAQVSAPEYELHGGKLQRKAGGGYEIDVAKDLKYVGGTRFHIRQAADAEQHLFADSDASGVIKRLVWVQVESQLPGQTWQYEYPSPMRVKLGDLNFITDTRAFREYVADNPTSDHAVVDRQLREHKLRWAGPVIGLRMIYLPDAERRRELMIIYMEPLPAAEASKFKENQDNADRWPKELAKVKADAVRDLKAKLAH